MDAVPVEYSELAVYVSHLQPTFLLSPMCGSIYKDNGELRHPSKIYKHYKEVQVKPSLLLASLLKAQLSIY